MTERERVHDVLVLGGGPAGAAAALALARRGLDVVLLDKARFPRPKFCGEYVSPGAVAELEALGVRIAEAPEASRSIGIRLGLPGGRVLDADYPEGAPAPFGVSVSRTVLDDALLRAARAAGADVREETRAADVLVEETGRTPRVGGAVSVGCGPRTEGPRVPIRARVTIGAEGRASLVAARLGDRRIPRWPRRFAFGAHFSGMNGFAGRCEMHLLPEGCLGAALDGTGTANVVFALSRRAARPLLTDSEGAFDLALARVPGFRERAAGARRIDRVRALGPLASRSSRVAGDGWLLVGDAASFFDPITGEGIHRALRSAALAAEAVAASLERGSSLEPYARAFRRETAPRDRFDAALQIVLAHPLPARAASALLATAPTLAASIVARAGGCGRRSRADEPE